MAGFKTFNMLTSLKAFRRVVGVVSRGLWSGWLKHLDAARDEEKVSRIRTASNGKGAVSLQGVGGLGVMKGKKK